MIPAEPVVTMSPMKSTPASRTTGFTFRISDQDRERLNAFARANDLPDSAVIRLALKLFLREPRILSAGDGGGGGKLGTSQGGD